MNNTNIHSEKLLDIKGVQAFAKNITLTFSKNLEKHYINKFPGYYIFKVPVTLVNKVYFQGFFLSQKYFEAIEKGLFSKKWEKYIRDKKDGEYYILDAHDYNGEMWKYLLESKESFNIEFYGEIFWIYHDIGHVYLDHLYSEGTFIHKDEMDASIFAVIKLLLAGDYNDKKIKGLIVLAAKDCLKTGKIINHDDIKYLFTYIDILRKTLQL